MKNYNLSINQELNRTFDLKGENSAEVADFIQPVKEILPFKDIILTANQATSGTISVGTLPSGKDTYITEVYASFVKDATCDIASGNIAMGVTINGVSRNILRLPVLTTTAQTGDIVISFYPPLKPDRGSAITLGGTYTAGLMSRSAGVFGYTQETTKGV